MELTNSKRVTYTATHVTTQLTTKEQAEHEAQPGRGVPKANVMRSLAVKPPELDLIEARLDAGGFAEDRSHLERLFGITKLLSTDALEIAQPGLAELLAPVPDGAVAEFAAVVADIRQREPSVALLIDLFNQQRCVLPIGRLHLERIEMYPAGVERGELVFSVPMAPEETVTIAHKEWSTSSQEYEDIVQDYFESYSERGVAEKTDASMSAESESKHSSAFNFGASLSGGYGGVTLTTTLGITATKDERESVKSSAQRGREVTQKASARTRQEHKVSVKLETKHGVEDTSSRTITNALATPVRIDYYRMMRKWRTDLLRYGLRLTYDVAIPTPGARLWGLHERLADIDRYLETPMQFPLHAEDIVAATYRQVAQSYGAVVDDLPAPHELITQQVNGPPIYWNPSITNFAVGRTEFDTPEGYVIQSSTFRADVIWPWKTTETVFEFRILNAEPNNSVHFDGTNHYNTLSSSLPRHIGAQGHVIVDYQYRAVESAAIHIAVQFQLTSEKRIAWQGAVLKAIYAAASAQHQQNLANLQKERDTLWRALNLRDTLTLRRLEREELVRAVVQWLVGPAHSLLTTPGVQQTVSIVEANEEKFDPTFVNVTEQDWSDALTFGEFVKFVHQAVEWENIVYFLYPYFWGAGGDTRRKLLFEHTDPEHERFLRAGYARIVITVRPGFEKAFTNFVETGKLKPDFVSSYVPIAEEIANFARTNYAGIPPANPEVHARPLLYPEQRATWDTMQEVMTSLDDFHTKNDRYPTQLSELNKAGDAEATDAWGKPFIYRQPGLGAGYDLESLGADYSEGGDGLNADISSAAGASLVATWYDYTPTSALDIEMDTKPGDIA